MAGGGHRPVALAAATARARHAATGSRAVPAGRTAVDGSARVASLIGLIGGVAALLLGLTATVLGWFLWRL